MRNGTNNRVRPTTCSIVGATLPLAETICGTYFDEVTVGFVYPVKIKPRLVLFLLMRTPGVSSERLGNPFLCECCCVLLRAELSAIELYLSVCVSVSVRCLYLQDSSQVSLPLPEVTDPERQQEELGEEGEGMCGTRRGCLVGVNY